MNENRYLIIKCTAALYVHVGLKKNQMVENIFFLI